MSADSVYLVSYNCLAKFAIYEVLVHILDCDHTMQGYFF